MNGDEESDSKRSDRGNGAERTDADARTDRTDRTDRTGADDTVAIDTQDGRSGTDRRERTGGTEMPSDDTGAPLSDLASRINSRRRKRKAEDDSPFEEMTVGEVDNDDLWESLLDDSVDSEATGRSSTGPVDVEVPGAISRERLSEGEFADADFKTELGAETVVVEKETYCQQCEYFSNPPAVACEYEGTEIVSVVDRNRFEVRDCPIVAANDEPLEES